MRGRILHGGFDGGGDVGPIGEDGVGENAFHLIHFVRFAAYEDEGDQAGSFAAAEAKADVATGGRAPAEVDQDGVDGIPEGVLEVSRRAGGGRDVRYLREAGCAELPDAVFGFGFVPVDQDEVHHELVG